MIDAAGAVIGSRVFDTFGRVVSSSGSVDRFAYQGREWEDAVGLYQFRSRWYDPQTGQFVSEDGLGFAAGDANLRRFVFNDPLRFTDPSGHLAIPEYTVHGARAAAGAMIESMFICVFINALFNIGMEQATGREPTGEELRFQLAMCVAFAIPGASFAALEAMSAHNALRASAAAASARAAWAQAAAAAQSARAAAQAARAAGAPYKAAMRKADQAGLAAGRANLAARRATQASGREAAEGAAKQAQRFAQEAKAAAEAAKKASKDALGKVQPKTLPMTPKGPPPGTGRSPGAPGASGAGRVGAAPTAGRQFSIGRANSTGAGDLAKLGAYGESITNNPAAARLHRRLIEGGYQHDLDFGPVLTTDDGLVLFGQHTRVPRRITVFARAHDDGTAILGTFGHEARHGVDALRRIPLGTRWSEFRAHVQDFMVTRGRYPTATEAQDIATGILQNPYYRQLPADPMDSLLQQIAVTGHGN